MILGKESVEEGHKQAENIKEEGRRKIGMPMVHDDNDRDTLSGIEGGLEGAMNAP